MNPDLRLAIISAAVSIVTPFALTGLAHLFALVKLPKAARAIALWTPTITALLPAIEDQVLHGPSLVLAAKDVVEASKANPDDARLVRASAVLRKLVGGLSIVALALLTGCNGVSGESVLKSAIDVRNQIAGVEVLAARELHTRCTTPMEAIAKETEPQRGFDAKELALHCDPLVEAYDSERRSRLGFDQAIGQVSTGKVTVGDMLVMLQTLIADASALEKEIAQ